MSNHKLPEVPYVLRGKRIKHPVSAPGIKVDKRGSWSWEYTGEAPALLAAGLVREEWLPGNAGCPNSTTFGIYVDGRKFSIKRQARRQFLLDVYFKREPNAEPDDDDDHAREVATGEARAAGNALGDAPPPAKHTTKPAHDDGDDDDDDDDWPPKVDHNPAIELGDGTRWHYRASADVLLLEGVLDADEIPGNPACKYQWRTDGWHDGKLFMATRLGKHVAVTLLGEGTSIISCRPLQLKRPQRKRSAS